MKKGITESGFEFEIEDEVLDDYELLEVLTEVDAGDLTVVPKMVDLLLGKEQKTKLKEHVRATKGRVSTQAMMDEISAILSSNGELKN